MIPFDPFAWFYSFIGYLQEASSRLMQAAAYRLQETRLYRKVYELFLNTPIGSEGKNTPDLQDTDKRTFSENLAEFLQLILHYAIVQPFYGLMDLLGLSFEWLLSRQWLSISVLCIPMLCVATSAFSVWVGSQMDRLKLTTHYFQLGVKELEKLEAIREAELEAARKNQESANPVSLSDQRDQQIALSNSANLDDSSRYRYAEMLFNRSLMLQPLNNWRYVLGATLLDNSAYEPGRKMLRRIAPDNSQGMPEAHAAVATGILNRLNATGDQELVASFIHHARAGLSWRGTAREVLIALSEAYWQQGAREESLEVLKITAERFKGYYTAVFQRAADVGNQKIAEEVKPKAISELEAALAAEPTKAELRVRLVQMYDTDKAGLVRAEKKIREGIELQPTPLLSRALSEIYRLLFIRQLIESQQTLADLNLLDMALQTDPSNPLVTDEICRMITNHQRPLEELSQGLYSILASGVATGCVHALLAEIHLYNKNPDVAQNHLEQVYKIIPHASKFTNELARIYAGKQRTEEAIRICVESLSILDRSGLLKERYVDELLHTAGELFLQVGRNADAESAFENALKANPKRENTRMALIQHYRNVGKEKEASIHEQYLVDNKDTVTTSPTTIPNQ